MVGRVEFQELGRQGISETVSDCGYPYRIIFDFWVGDNSFRALAVSGRNNNYLIGMRLCQR